MDRCLEIMQYNVRSLSNKITEFRDYLDACDYDVVCVTETWLHGDIPDTAVNITGYNIVRRDRRDGRGGGVCVYVRSSIQFTLMESSNSIEQLWLRLSVGKRSYAVGVVYRSEIVRYGVFLDKWEDSISEILSKCDDFFCFGDFNIDLLDEDDHSARRLNELLDCYNLRQIVDSPTRITPRTSTLIDLIIVSNVSLVLDVNVLSLGLSDHELTSCSLRIRSPKILPTYKTIRDHRCFDEAAFLSELDLLPFHAIFRMADVDDKLAFFSNLLLGLFDLHAPLRTVRFTRRPAPWLTENLRLLMSIRDAAHTRWKKSRLNEHYEYYKSVRNFTTLACRNEKKAYIDFCVRRDGPNAIWNNLGLNKPKQAIPPSLQNVNLLNDYYINNVVKIPADYRLLSKYSNSVRVPGDRFGFRFVTQEEVYNIICSVKSKAVGSDGISISLLKMCCPHILPFVTHIVNSCIEKSVFPEAWKQAIVTPIPKITNPTSSGDLRPISILPALSKVLERLMEGQLRRHLNVCNILPVKQSGFRSMYSCGTALLNVTDDILRASDNGLITVLVLFDFSKAFDMLNHEILLALLCHIGLDDHSVNLFRSYFSGRSQKVRINEKLSEALGLSSGVPQGSILGPMLYTLYTMYLPDALKTCGWHLYADDTQIYYSFKKEDVAEAVDLVNADIVGLLNFAESHSLKVNSAKTKILLFGPPKDRLAAMPHMRLKVGSDVIGCSDLGRNLGVTFDSDLRFRAHIARCIKVAYLNLKLIYSNRFFLSKKTKIILCESLVLSRFNFCDFVYGPCILARDKHRIQVIQNSCMRLIFGIRRRQHISHRLDELGWLNMANRRLLHAACLFYRIIQYKTPPYLYEKIQFRTDVHSLNLRFRGRLTPPKHRTERFKSSYSYQITAIFNSVPEGFRLFSEVKFRRSVKLWLLSRQNLN